jgi:polyphosphate kinase
MHAVTGDPREFFNAELSLLAFQHRVLALAEDRDTPLLERLRFLAIVSSNVDELYMVRMAELRLAALDDDGTSTQEHGDGLTASGRLQAVEADIAALLRAQARCAAACLADAARHGVPLLTWRALTDVEKATLSARYRDELHPDLSPLAITLSPGVPLPHLPHLGLFVAIVHRATGESRSHVSEHELPRDVPRLLAVPGRTGAVIAIEEVLRANVHLLYPGQVVESAHLFRVTRGGDLHLQEEHAGDLLHAVASATARRPHNPAVRVEVEGNTPPHVRALLLDNLRRDALGREMAITLDDVQVVDGLLDLRCLQSLPLPPDASLEYAPLTPRRTIASRSGLLDGIAAGDVLVHHPFESFDDTVVRFFQEAATDPDVASISTTLYRVGNPSPIVDALLVAAASGKRVFALVELQARFDEAHNVQWARALERAGGHVVYGLPGLKVHAKVALVERNEAHGTARYAHVGSGNYNPRSGRQYTDLSLFTSRPVLTGDVAALLDALSCGDVPRVAADGGALVAPHALRTALLSRIAREAGHARAGRHASIAIKVNGLADREVVRSLYDASSAGVTIDLIVRGICTLRPGVPGISERIRVASVVGRFLEHSRIFRFENGGEPEYFIGSADLRPRNLRRRVEVLIPVFDAGHRVALDDILATYQSDATAWDLDASGAYTQRATGAAGAQAIFSLHNHVR